MTFDLYILMCWRKDWPSGWFFLFRLVECGEGGGERDAEGVYFKKSIRGDFTKNSLGWATFFAFKC